MQKTNLGFAIILLKYRISSISIYIIKQKKISDCEAKASKQPDYS